MKRLFILASAAALMLASCAKTTVVYNEAPEEIGFKAVTGVMTKAGEPTKLPESENLGVFAHLYDNSVEGELYFGNTQFTYDTDSWKGTKYWPISNGLIFTVYSPYNGTKVDEVDAVQWDSENKKLSFLADDNTSTQTDYLYGTNRPNGVRSENSVAVVLGHALAKVTINVKASDANVVSIMSLSLNKTRQSGKCTVAYNPFSVVWDNKGNETDKQLIASETALTSDYTTVEYLVVPDALDNEVLTFTYKLKGSDKVLTYSTSIKVNENPNQLGSAWVYGKNYIYNIIITPLQIKFDAKESIWTNVTDIDADSNADDDINI